MLSATRTTAHSERLMSESLKWHESLEDSWSGHKVTMDQSGLYPIHAGIIAMIHERR